MPLILKVNGKTDVPPDDDAFSTTNASVEDAVRLGADAVGYTMYLGSPRQGEDLHQLKGVREDCDRYGMPLVIWAYPRGSAIEEKGGRDSFYAIDYAARMAMEMGADVVKLNMPKLDPEKDKDSPAPYNEMEVTQEEAIQHCVASAGRSLVVLSGGSKTDDEAVLEHTKIDHGGRRLGRDLRPQRLAARVERGAGDHRPDQGEPALQRAPDSLGSQGRPIWERRAQPGATPARATRLGSQPPCRHDSALSAPLMGIGRIGNPGTASGRCGEAAEARLVEGAAVAGGSCGTARARRVRRAREPGRNRSGERAGPGGDRRRHDRGPAR